MVWEGRDRLLIPGGAVFRQDDGWAVYVLQQGRARLRPIQLGRRNSSAMERVSGLSPGTYVIQYPTDQVRDGVRVESQ